MSNIALLFPPTGIEGKEHDDSDLISSLFQNYHNSVRPNCGGAVQVKIGLAVRQIVDLVSFTMILFVICKVSKIKYLDV